MKCHNCGFELFPNAKFCGECGTKVIPQDNIPQAPIQQPSYDDQPTATQDIPTVQTPSFAPIQPMPAPQPVAAEPVPQPVAEPVPQPMPVPEPVAEPNTPFTMMPDNTIQPQQMPKANNKNKKSKKWLVITLCVVLVAALAVVLFFLLKPVSFSENPEEYTYNLFESTCDDFMDDLDTAEENLFGFDVSTDEPFTLNMDYSFISYYGDEYNKRSANIAFANDPSDEELLLSVNSGDRYDSFKLEAFLDDDYIGFRLPDVHDNFIVAPSEDFGEELMDSNGALGKVLKSTNSNGNIGMASSVVLYTLKNTLEDIDLSYSDIIDFLNGNTAFAKELDRIASKEIIALLEKSNIGERKDIQYAFDNGTVNAKSYDIELQPADLIEAFYNVIKGVRDSKVMQDILGDEIVSLLGMMLPNMRYVDISEMPSITLRLVEYDDRLVEITLLSSMNDEVTIRNIEYTIEYTIKSTDKNSILGGIKLEFDRDSSSSEDGYEWKNNYSINVGFTSNWMTEDEKISVKFYGNSSHEYYSKYEGEEFSDNYGSSVESVIDFDFDNGTWHAYDSRDGEITYSIGGTCSNDNGFNFGLNYDDSHEYYDYEYAMDYEEWLDEQFDTLKSSYHRSMYNNSDYYSYTEWCEDNADYYDAYHYTFEEWLEEYYGEYPYDIYRKDTYEDALRSYDVTHDLKLSLTDKASLKFRSGDYDNIFEWDENDFENYVRLVDSAY